MRRNKGRRMNPSSGYIGSGNKTSVFTRRSKSPFSKIKEIYGEELERINSEFSENDVSVKKLSENEKLEIRNRIKKELIVERKKQVLAGLILILFVTLLIILMKSLFGND